MNNEVTMGRKLTLLLAGVCTVASGALIAPIMPALGLSTGSETLVPYAMLLPNLAMMFFAPFVGKLLDKYGRLTFMRIGLLGYALLGSAGYFVVDNIYALLTLRFFFGIFTVLNMTAISTLVADYFSGDPGGRAKFSGYQGTFASIAAVIVIQAGATVGEGDFRNTFLMYFMGLVFLLLTFIFLKEPVRDVSVNVSGEKVKLITKDIFSVLLTLGIGMAIYYASMVYTPFLLKALNATSSQTAIAINLVTGVSAVSAFFYGKLKAKLSFEKIYTVSFGLIAVGYFFIGFADSLNTIYLGAAIAGLGCGLLLPNSAVSLMSKANPKVMGGVLGIMISFVFGGNFSAGLIAPPIISSLGYNYVFIIFAGISTIISLGYLLHKKSN